MCDVSLVSLPGKENKNIKTNYINSLASSCLPAERNTQFFSLLFVFGIYFYLWNENIRTVMWSARCVKHQYKCTKSLRISQLAGVRQMMLVCCIRFTRAMLGRVRSIAFLHILHQQHSRRIHKHGVCKRCLFFKFNYTNRRHCIEFHRVDFIALCAKFISEKSMDQWNQKEANDYILFGFHIVHNWSWRSIFVDCWRQPLGHIIVALSETF